VHNPNRAMGIAFGLARLETALGVNLSGIVGDALNNTKFMKKILDHVWLCVANALLTRDSKVQ
jgi:hypothetical protein